MMDVQISAVNDASLFSRVYIRTDYIVGPTRFFRSFSLIKEFQRMLLDEPSFEKLSVTFEGEFLVFWVLVNPCNYDSIDNVITLQMDLAKLYPRKKFSFNVLGSTEWKKVPQNSYPIS